MSKIAVTKIINDDVQTAVSGALGAIGASSLFTRQGMVVLLKPNLLSAKPPERAVTTHPAVLRAVIRWVKQFAPARIYVCDSSGGFKPGTTERTFTASGLKQVCDEEGAVALPFEKTARKLYTVADPLVLNEFAGSKLLEEADLIINLPKIKTHGQTALTCCIKNMFGTVLLGHKAETHARFPSADAFAAALADVYSVSRPQLTVIDAYYCMEGKGPGAGDVVKLDLVLAGYDGVALDTAVCRLIGLEPKKVRHIDKAAEKQLGTTDLSRIEFCGEKIEDVARPFKRANTAMESLPLPGVMAGSLAKVFTRAKISFDPLKCRLCATCWENCPVAAISPPADMQRGNIPGWDSNTCIVCYCCAELCPYEAIDFEFSLLRNFIFSWIGAALVAVLLVLLAALVILLV